MENIIEQAGRLNAPGCYAAPSVFSHDSEVCQGCPAFESCSQECIKTLQELRERVNIEDILARHRRAKASTIEQAKPPNAVPKIDIGKFLPSVKVPVEKVEQAPKPKEPQVEVPDDHQKVLDALKEKPRALALKWCRDGMIEKIRSDLAQGINPFASQARQNFESVTCELLINGAVTKQALKKAFMTRLGAKRPWSEGAAASHVNIALQALQGFGIIVETAEGYVVAPRTGSDNV
jgi:hypothetical protein